MTAEETRRGSNAQCEQSNHADSDKQLRDRSPTNTPFVAWYASLSKFLSERAAETTPPAASRSPPIKKSTRGVWKESRRHSGASALEPFAHALHRKAVPAAARHHNISFA